MNESQLILNEIISILKQMQDNDWLNEKYNLENGTTLNILKMLDRLHYQLPMYNGYGIMSELATMIKKERQRIIPLVK